MADGSPVSQPLVVDFPLRGEWFAPNTPGKRVPSHGTDSLGQRYAFDFVRPDPATESRRFHRGSTIGYLIGGVGLRGCAPHLHFQLMDRPDLLRARGLPCCFRDYEVFRSGAWETVENGIPKHTERIRRL